ncbi:hypothetical protein ACMD2_27477 [Ananas comosus]|uniref:Uncharacterized protein n=1 Tax=Ananas comosus TaxID=4615 RepID=A0A199VMS5_ANACO|nr:hypothetical protein ACMD2_27477 [Ananas comosus]
MADFDRAPHRSSDLARGSGHYYYDYDRGEPRAYGFGGLDDRRAHPPPPPPLALPQPPPSSSSSSAAAAAAAGAGRVLRRPRDEAAEARGELQGVRGGGEGEGDVPQGLSVDQGEVLRDHPWLVSERRGGRRRGVAFP